MFSSPLLTDLALNMNDSERLLISSVLVCSCLDERANGLCQLVLARFCRWRHQVSGMCVVA